MVCGTSSVLFYRDQLALNWLVSRQIIRNAHPTICPEVFRFPVDIPRLVVTDDTSSALIYYFPLAACKVLLDVLDG